MPETIKIKSIFNTSAIFDIIWMLLAKIGVLTFMIFVLVNNDKGMTLSLVAFQLFFMALLALGIYILKGFKHIIIDVSNKKITYYSLLKPFGKPVYLKDFKAIFNRWKPKAMETLKRYIW